MGSRGETRGQVMLCMWIGCLYSPTREKLCEDYLMLKNSQLHRDSSTVGRKQALSGSAAGNHNPYHPDHILPPLASAVKVYEYISNIAHVVSVLSTLSLIYYDHGEARPGGTPEYLCFMPRFLVHRVLGVKSMTYLACVFSMLQLGWRALILLYQRRFNIDTLTYLLIDDEVVEANLNPNLALETYRQYHTLDLVKRVLFYKIEDKLHNQLAFGLRSNRTPEARAKLTRQLNRGFILCNYTFLIAALILWPMGFYTVLYELNNFYPGCQPHSWDLVHAIRATSSTILCITLFLDCVGTLTYTLVLLVILINDLKIYWRQIMFQLAELDVMMRDCRVFSDSFSRQPETVVNKNKKLKQQVAKKPTTGRLDEKPTLLQSSYKHHVAQYPDRQLLSKIGKVSRLDGPYGEQRCFDDWIYVFQATVSDFFAKLRDTDDFMSLALGWLFVTWVTFNAVITFTGLQLVNSSGSILTRGIQIFILLVFVILSIFILTLKQATDPAYRAIGSLMAVDPSREKERWVVLMRYYTGKPRNAFTIFHSGLFTLLVFFKSFSYSITFAIYMYSVRYQSSSGQLRGSLA